MNSTLPTPSTLAAGERTPAAAIQGHGHAHRPAGALPMGSAGKHASGWFGILALIVTEGSLFFYLLLCYFYLAMQAPVAWPPGGPPRLMVPALNTLVLLASSLAVWASERAIKRGRRAIALTAMAVAIALGTAFVVVQLGEWRNKAFSLTTHQYGSLYFTITGFHLLHVVIGLGVLLFLFLWMALGYFDERRHAALTIGGVYWHFVDAVWLFVFASLYLTPYLR
jgi:cytochrome c oxidase subunit 3